MAGVPQPVGGETVVHTSVTHSHYSTPDAKELEHWAERPAGNRHSAPAVAVIVIYPFMLSWCLTRGGRSEQHTPGRCPCPRSPRQAERLEAISQF